MSEVSLAVVAAPTQAASAQNASSPDSTASPSAGSAGPSVTLTYCPLAHTSWTTFPYTSTVAHSYATTTLYTTATSTITHSAAAATVSLTTTAAASESSPALSSDSSLRSSSSPLSTDTRAPSGPHRRRPYGVAHLHLPHSGQRNRRTQDGSDSASVPPSQPSWIDQQQQTWTEYSLVPTLATSAVVSQPSCYVTVVPASATSSPSSVVASTSTELGSPEPSPTSSPTATASPGIPAGLYTRTRVSYATVSEMDYYTVTRTYTLWTHVPSSASHASNRTSSAPLRSSALPEGTLAQGWQPTLMASNEVGKIVGGVVGGVGGSLVLLLLLLCLLYPARRHKSGSSSKNGLLSEKGPSPPPSGTVAAAGDASNPLSANAQVEPSATSPPPPSPSANGRLTRVAGLFGFAPARQERLDRLFNPSQVHHHIAGAGSTAEVPEAWRNPSDIGTPDLFDRSPVDGAMQMTLSTSLGTMDSPQPYGAGAPGTPHTWAAPLGSGAVLSSPRHNSVQGQSPTTASPTEMRHSTTGAGGSMPPSLGTSGNLAAAQGQSPSPDTTPSPQTPVNPIAAPLIGPGQWLSGKHVEPGTPEEALASEGPAPIADSEAGNETVDVPHTTESVSLRQEETNDSSDEPEGQTPMASALSFPQGPAVDYTLDGDLSNRPPTGLNVPASAAPFHASNSLEFPATSSTGSTDAHHTRPARPSSPLMGEGSMVRMAAVQPEFARPASLHGPGVLHMPVPVRPVVLPSGTAPSSLDHQTTGLLGRSASDHGTLSESDPTDFQTALSVSIPQLYHPPSDAASRSAIDHAPSERSAASSSPAAPLTWAYDPVGHPVSDPEAATAGVPPTPMGANFPPSRYSRTLGKLESEEVEDQMATAVAQGSFSAHSRDQSGDPTPRMPPRPLGEVVGTVGTEAGARSSVYSPRPPDWPISTPGASLGTHDGPPAERVASSESSEDSAAAHGTRPPHGVSSWSYEPRRIAEGLPPSCRPAFPADGARPGPSSTHLQGPAVPDAPGTDADGELLPLDPAVGASAVDVGRVAEPVPSSVLSAPEETLSAETLSVAASQSASPVGFLPVPVIIDPNFSSGSSALRTSGESNDHVQAAAPEEDGFFGRPRTGPLLVVNSDPHAPQSSSSTLPPRSN